MTACEKRTDTFRIPTVGFRSEGSGEQNIEGIHDFVIKGSDQHVSAGMAWYRGGLKNACWRFPPRCCVQGLLPASWGSHLSRNGFGMESSSIRQHTWYTLLSQGAPPTYILKNPTWTSMRPALDFIPRRPTVILELSARDVFLTTRKVRYLRTVGTNCCCLFCFWYIYKCGFLRACSSTNAQCDIGLFKYVPGMYIHIVHTHCLNESWWLTKSWLMLIVL